MSTNLYELHGLRVFECEEQGPPIATDRDAVDLIALASQHAANMVAIPITRLGGEFFHLRTRMAGEVLQKFVTYGIRVAIIGDISQHVAQSGALRDFVYESNRGDHVWFVQSRDELRQRLQNANS